jgi:hypothetical protein
VTRLLGMEYENCKRVSKPILAFLFALCSSLSAAERPNIIIFLADDLGYADVGFNGCEDIPTPNIDSIAAKGVKFTDGYANHPPNQHGLQGV